MKHKSLRILLPAVLLAGFTFSSQPLHAGGSCCPSGAKTEKVAVQKAKMSAASCPMTKMAGKSKASCSTEKMAAKDGSCTYKDSLTDQLKAYNLKSKSKLDKATLTEFKGYTEDLAASGITEEAVATGDRLPGFSLPNAVGKEVSLQGILEDGPAVLVFYRGGWCPYCNITLQAYQEHLDAMQKMGAQLVAISPEKPDDALSTREKHDLSFQVLSDVNNDYARKLGIVYELPEGLEDRYLNQFNLPLTAKAGSPETYELPLTATYIVDQSGKVRWSYLNADYTERADPLDVIEALRTMPGLTPKNTEKVAAASLKASGS